jgi:hypothetical protein
MLTLLHPDRRKSISRPHEIDAWTGYDFPARKGKYNATRYRHQHFNGIDWDHRTRNKAIYKFVGDGCSGWANDVDKENGNYDYLFVHHTLAQPYIDEIALECLPMLTIGTLK